MKTKSTQCVEMEPRLAALLFEELEPAEKAEVEEHLRKCLHCQMELRELQGSVDFLRERFQAEATEPVLAADRVESFRQLDSRAVGSTAEGGCATHNGLEIGANIDVAQPPSAGIVFVNPNGVVSSAAEASPARRRSHFNRWLIGVGGLAAAATVLMVLPNYLDRQSRNRISRIAADTRSLAGAIESYYVDNLNYPAVDSSQTIAQAPASAEDSARLHLLDLDKDAKKLEREIASTVPALNTTAAGGGQDDPQVHRFYAPGLNAPPAKQPAATTSIDDRFDRYAKVQVTEARAKEFSADFPPNELRQNVQSPANPASGAAPASVIAGGSVFPSRQSAGSAIADVDADGDLFFNQSPAPNDDPKQVVAFHYDPSGGTTSAGDVYRIRQGPAQKSDFKAEIKAFDVQLQTSTTKDALQRARELQSARSNEAKKRVEVAQLFRESNNLAKAKNYDQSVAKIDRILATDPGNQLALQRRKVLEGVALTETGKALQPREIASVPEAQIIPPEVQPPAPPVENPNSMVFKDYGVNPFVDTKSDPLSTFAIDVDKASYTMVRNYLQRGALPPFPAVRVEEIINYFPNNYPAPTSRPFAIYPAMSPSPFGKGFYLLQIGIKGYEIPSAQRKPLVLTFILDVSGSMRDSGKLELVKRSLQMLIGRMKPEDRIGIAVFSDKGREVISHTPIREADKIYSAINALSADGSTNAEEGLTIGYAMARRAFDSASVNRVILCSDGVANVGLTHPDALLGEIAASAKNDIYLTTIGVGMGGVNDVLLEQLADKGNGHYAFIDNDGEARHFIDKDLLQGMEVIAQDVKLQVEFNPAAVAQYRLIGFENRDVADKDFRNDKVDAGEIGAGHSVTALYELELAKGNEQDQLGTVYIRYKQPAAEMAVKEIKGALSAKVLLKDFSAQDDHFKIAAIAAEYAEILRNSYWARGSKMEDVAKLFDAEFPGNPPTPEAADLRGLIDVADRLTANRPAPVLPERSKTAQPSSDDGPKPLKMEEFSN